MVHRFSLRHLTSRLFMLKGSWRMMLRSKTGYVSYLVKDPKTGKEWGERPSAYLSVRQYNNMIGKPDMMLQFAHFISSKYKAEGYTEIQLFCINGISINGRKNQPIIPLDLDLNKITNKTPVEKWILPLIL